MTAPDPMPLVERLRKTAHAMDWGYATSADNMPLPDVLRKVADEIERLTATLEAEKAEVFRLRDALAQAKGVPEGWDLTLDQAACEMLFKLMHPATPESEEYCEVRLQYGDGHSGHGLYASLSEYPEEGAELLVQSKPAATPPSPAQASETAWLVEWKAHGFGPQWWGFNYEPGKHGMWCADANKAVRFAREEDAERMRLHVIAVAGLTGHHEYERSISATEHEWVDGKATSPAQAAGWRDIESAPRDDWEECGANGAQGCYFTNSGPNGERQCEFCGAPPPAAPGHPPSERQGLTDEQIEDCIDRANRKFNGRRMGPCGQQMTPYDDWKYWLVREVEAAHGIGIVPATPESAG